MYLPWSSCCNNTWPRPPSLIIATISNTAYRTCVASPAGHHTQGLRNALRHAPNQYYEGSAHVGSLIGLDSLWRLREGISGSECLPHLRHSMSGASPEHSLPSVATWPGSNRWQRTRMRPAQRLAPLPLVQVVVSHHGMAPRPRLEQGDKRLQALLELDHDPSPSQGNAGTRGNTFAGFSGFRWGAQCKCTYIAARRQALARLPGQGMSYRVRRHDLFGNGHPHAWLGGLDSAPRPQGWEPRFPRLDHLRRHPYRRSGSANNCPLPARLVPGSGVFAFRNRGGSISPCSPFSWRSKHDYDIICLRTKCKSNSTLVIVTG
jgi:hypothetical protein